jgi:tetratricopeptide (TPR) repeat protein
VSAAQLAEVARRFGARVEELAGGGLAAALANPGPAVDQAADAARLALALGTLLPDAPIAVATGRGVLADRLPVSDAIDRAVRLLEQRAPGVWIDSVTAALLEARFAIDGDGRLGAERRGPEATRSLMGRPTPCVGREPELGLLDTAFAECAAEPVARAVLVLAPSGVGKSRLRHEWLRRLEERREPARVLNACGDPMSAGSSFGLAAQLLRAAAGELDHPGLERYLGERLPASDAARVATFLGEMAGVASPAPSADLVAARAAPLLMSDQIRLAWVDWLAAETAARPVVLVLDDLHWGDAPSVRLIDAALAQLRERPLFVLALGRRDVQDLFPELWEERGLHVMRLGDLSRRASAELARAVLGADAPASIVEWIGARAGGNALWLEELIRAVAERGERELAPPESVLAMVQARLSALPVDGRRLLRAASVFGDVFWSGAVETLLGLAPGAAAAGLEELCARETIMRRRDSRFAGQVEHSFRHALFRDAAYAMLTDADRVLGHRLAAAWLEGAGERQPLVLAEHLERGGEAGRAALQHARAAEEALQGNDYAGALSHVARGAAAGASGATLGRLLLLRAEACFWRGETADAESAAAEAMALLPERSAAWCDAAGQALAARLPARRELLFAVVERLAEPPDPGDAARSSWVRAGATAVRHLLFHGERAAAGRLAAAVQAAASGAAGIAAGAAQRMLAALHDFDGAHDAARRAYLAAAEQHEALGDLRTACQLRVNVGWLEATELGLPESAEPVLRDALELARRLGIARSIASAQQNLGVALMQQGRLDEARALLEETVTAFARQHDPRMEGGSCFYLAELHTAAGRFTEAEAQAARALTLAADVPTTRACTLAALARARVAAGRPDAAVEAAEEAQRILDELGGIEEGEALIRLALAEARHAAGDLVGARAAISVARARLEARAAPMTDPEVRRAFRERQPENARTLALAAAWT